MKFVPFVNASRKQCVIVRYFWKVLSHRLNTNKHNLNCSPGKGSSFSEILHWIINPSLTFILEQYHRHPFAFTGVI